MQHIGSCHCLQHLLAPVHLAHYHGYAVGYTHAEQNQHNIKPFLDIQAVMETDAHQKYQEGGSINAATHKVHLPAVGTCGLYVIDDHGDEREAGGIDEDVDDRPENVVGSTETESHLHHILYRQSYHGENDHPAGTLILLIHPSYIQESATKMALMSMNMKHAN